LKKNDAVGEKEGENHQPKREHNNNKKIKIREKRKELEQKKKKKGGTGGNKKKPEAQDTGCRTKVTGKGSKKSTPLPTGFGQNKGKTGN